MQHAQLAFLSAPLSPHTYFPLQMLEIHERFNCGIPVILEGETGVGKTALVEMLSVLWNESLLGEWRLLRDRVLTQLGNCNCKLSGRRVYTCMYALWLCTLFEVIGADAAVRFMVGRREVTVTEPPAVVLNLFSGMG